MTMKFFQRANFIVQKFKEYFAMQFYRNNYVLSFVTISISA